MGHQGKDDGGWLTGYTSAGAALAIAGDGSITTANSTTYYIPLGIDFARLPSELSMVSVHLKWAAAQATVFTLEGCNFPRRVGGMRAGGGYDVEDYDTTAGNWIQINPSTAYVPVVGTDNLVSSATITAGGTNAGGAIYELVAIAERRVRIKAVVTTGAKLWVNVHGKAAAV